MEGLREDENGKRRASVLSSLRFSVICACIEFFSEVGNSLKGANFWSCALSAKS